MSDQKLQIIIKAMDETKQAFTSLQGNIQNTSGLVKDLALAFGAVGIGALVKQLSDQVVGYNKTLETSRLGLGAIYTSMTEITNAQGEMLQGQEKFRAAQGLATIAQKELQQIAMLTSATFRELVEVYQGIAAPALSAKMSFKETLEIAGLLTNAVKAIGLPMNQIKQEARDLIQGGISAQSSSLATSLGINDAMVKKWREAGTVFSELKTRLEGFVYASNEFANTWEGAWSNIIDIGQRALGEGFKPAFEYLKQEMITLVDKIAIIRRDANGVPLSVEIRPEIKARLEEITSTLLTLMKTVKDIAIAMVEFLAKWWEFIAIIKLTSKLYAWSAGLISIAQGLQAVAAGGTAANAALTRGPIGLLLTGTALSVLQFGKEYALSKSLTGFSGSVDKELVNQGKGAAKFSHELYEPLLRAHPRLASDPRAVAALIGRGTISQDALGFLNIPDKSVIDTYYAEAARAEEDAARGLTMKSKPKPPTDEQKKAAEKARIDAAKRELEVAEHSAKAAEQQEKRDLAALDAVYDLKVRDLEIGKDRLGLEIELDKLYGRTTEAEALTRQYETEKKIIEAKQTSIQAQMHLIALNNGDNPELGTLQKEYDLLKKQIEALGVKLELSTKISAKRLEDAEREAEIRDRLSVLDQAEKNMSLSKTDLLKGRLAIYGAEEARLQTAWQNAASGSMEKITFGDKLRDVKAKIVDVNTALKTQEGTFTQGLAKGLKSYEYAMMTTFQAGEKVIKDFAYTAEKSLSDGLFDVITNNCNSLADIWESTWKSMLRSLTDIIGKMIIQYALLGEVNGGSGSGGILGWLGIGGAGTGGTGTTTGAGGSGFGLGNVSTLASVYKYGSKAYNWLSGLGSSSYVPAEMASYNTMGAVEGAAWGYEVAPAAVDASYMSLSAGESAAWGYEGAALGESATAMEGAGVSMETASASMETASVSMDGASSALGSVGGIFAAVAAMAMLQSKSDDYNKWRYTDSAGNLVPAGTPGAVRTSDAFSGHFASDPFSLAVLKPGKATSGERFDAAIEQGDWVGSFGASFGVADYWSDPARHLLGQAADKYLGDGASWFVDPIGNFFDSVSDWFHEGGIVGLEGGHGRSVSPFLFANAPRAHGGLGPGERAIIAKDEEGVFTEGQMKAIGRGISQGGDTYITLNVGMATTDDAANYIVELQDKIDRNRMGTRRATVDYSAVGRRI